MFMYIYIDEYVEAKMIVRVKMSVENVSYADLARNPVLTTAFKKAIVQGLLKLLRPPKGKKKA